jgi:hypothetical protein
MSKLLLFHNRINANLIPDWRPETVSDHDFDFVKFFFGSFRRGQQVPADLADVLSPVAVVPTAVLPEVTNRKLFPEKNIEIFYCCI